MQKISFIFLSLLFFSCQQEEQDKRMLSVKKIVFETHNDIYREGYSDAEQPFVFYATSGDNMLYKYYFDSDRRDTIDLKTETKIKNLGKYFVFFLIKKIISLIMDILKSIIL